jgi:hypothetical protein
MPRRDTAQTLRIPIPLYIALLLVELAEDVGDLTPDEAQAVNDARIQIDRIVERHQRAGEP